MRTLLTFVLLAALCAGIARAQFAPPDSGGPTPTTPTAPAPDPGNSAASPGGAQNLLNIGPPPAAPNPNAVAPLPAAGSGGPLMPVHANQIMTANAMIGFVNDEPIFAVDIFRPIDADLRRLAATSQSVSDFRQSARALIANQLQQMVSDILVVEAAKAQLTKEDQERIDIYMALERSKLIAEHGGSIPAADRALSATGSSVDKEMADRRRKVIKDLYFQKNLMPKVVVTRQMELDAYDKEPKRWQQVAQVEMYTITLPVTRWLRQPTVNGQLGDIMAHPTAEQIRAAERQALATAEEICAKVRAGADFARLVEDYDSHDAARDSGGRTPTVNRGSMVNTSFEDYVFSLPANTLGQPQLLRQPDFRDSTVVVVKVGKKTEAHTVSFAEAQFQIALELKQAQLRDLQVREMDKLSKTAAIEAVDRMSGVALDAAVTRYAMN